MREQRRGAITPTDGKWTSYCGSAPDPSEWLTRWNGDPILLAALALGGFLWLRRPRDPDRDRPAAAGAVLIVFLFISPFCALATALFSARVVHHVILAAVLAPLLVFAFDLRRRRLIPLAPATAVHAAIFWAWHLPAFYSAALSDDLIFWAMQISITL